MASRTDVREDMEVMGSCGNTLGTVDRVEGNSIKLSKNDPRAGGMHHWIPMDWVDTVDEQVHLSKDCDEAMRFWRSEKAGAAG